MSAQTKTWPRPHRLTVDEYYRAPEYWVVDLVGNRVWRHRRPRGQQYEQRDEIEKGTLDLPGGLGTIAVAELF